MERLTKRNEEDTAYYYPLCFKKCNGFGASEKCNKCELSVKVCEKLGEYEDAEEQGLLIKLPCKVGGKVYVIAPNYNKCENHYECEEYDSEQYLITWCQDNCPKGFKGIGVVETKVVRIEIREGDIYLQTDRCGLRNTKNIFLTKEEAEQALAEMKGV